MQKIQPQNIPVRNDTVSWREFDTEGILFNPRSRSYSQLNEVGLMVWKHMDGRRSVQQIVLELAAHFEVAVDDVAKDVTEFIEDLISKELITVRS
jgi:hypothetical protein